MIGVYRLYAYYRNDLLLVGDLTDENAAEEDKPLNSVALAKFLGKAAKVTVSLTGTTLCFLSVFDEYAAASALKCIMLKYEMLTC